MSCRSIRSRASKLGYDKLRRPGFYRHILCDLSNIESCQVNWTVSPFLEKKTPALLMQDLSIVGMFAGPDLATFGQPAGIAAAELSDWHKMIDWWFTKYGRYAVAVKSQDAYSRDIDYERCRPRRLPRSPQRKVRGEPVAPEDQKALEDHLSGTSSKATKYKLPVKLHTGYYAGENGCPFPA